MTLRKAVRIILLILLVAAPISFTVDQFQMSAKVSHLKDQMENLIEMRESGKISSYNGMIDALVKERNEILYREGYAALGNWSTEGPTITIYYDGSWLSPKAFDLLKTQTDANGMDNPIDGMLALIIIAGKPFLFFILLFMFLFLKKPAQ